MKCLQCGDCCIRFDVTEIDKPAGVRCQYLDIENRCSIYENRPLTCKNHDYPFAICPIGLKNQDKVPTGKCLNCGGFLFNGEDFCNDKCRTVFAKSCGVTQ